MKKEDNMNNSNYISLISILLLLLIINSCNKENPTEKEINNPIDIFNPIDEDTLSREIMNDIFLFVDSLKDVYTLDEYILANVHLKNENNPSGLPIYIGNWPPFLSYRVENSLGEYISGGPSIIGNGVYDDTLKIGEEITDNIKWFQYIFDKDEMFSGLKAFTGNYRLGINFRGIDYENHPCLIKYFKISEDGDPLSYHLFRDYNSEDTVKIDFVLRNRINNEVILNTSNDSCGIFIVNRHSNLEPDTVFTQKFLLEQSVYNLAPLSDNVLYKLRYAKQDFINQEITGAFNIVIELNFVERRIISSNLLIIL